MKLRVIFAIAALIGIAGMASANLLVNSGFESGDMSSWNPGGPGWRTSSYGADMHSGTYGLVDDVQSTDSTEWRVIDQAVAVTAGQSYDVDAYLKGVSIQSGVSESWLELAWVNGSGGWVSSFQTTHLTADSDWTLMSGTDLVAPVGSVTADVRLVTHQIAGQAPSGTSYHMFDDVSFGASVPEPGTLGCIGLGSLIGLIVLRRQRHS